jgi:AcrR family transcriptional regulator
MATRTRTRGTAASRPARSRAAAPNGLPHAQVAEIQRARLLAGAVRAVDELGYTRATVTDITERSRVSRRTFYELFSNYEDCTLALLEVTFERVGSQIAAAGLAALPWRERVRGGLWSILCFFDREPALARFCVAQSARGGQRMLERREQILSELTAVIDEGRGEGLRGSDCPPLTAEGLAGAAVSILYARLSRREREPLTGLHGELMALIVLPYLGPAAARREQSRPAPAPSIAHTAQGDGGANGKQADVGGDPLQGIPMRLTYRTVRVLEAVAERPGASNRIVGDRAGIQDQGQISKLLARLKHLGLLENTGEGGNTKGEPNAWRLTPQGEQVTQTIRAHAHNNGQVA